MNRDPAPTVAGLYNLCWVVRYHKRQREKRKQAIQLLGLTLRQALLEAESPEDFESLLKAVVDGLSPRDDTTF